MRNWTVVESKRFNAMEYSPETSTLYIRFHPRKTDPGNRQVYAYANVTPDVFGGLRDASSKGQYLSAIIKDPVKYPFASIGTEPVEEALTLEDAGGDSSKLGTFDDFFSNPKMKEV